MWTATDNGRIYRGRKELTDRHRTPFFAGEPMGILFPSCSLRDALRAREDELVGERQEKRRQSEALAADQARVKVMMKP